MVTADITWVRVSMKKDSTEQSSAGLFYVQKAEPTKKR
jgi:hypothetical protein